MYGNTQTYSTKGLNTFLILTALIMMFWQVTVCVMKIESKPTGTSESLTGYVSNLSITFCANNFENDLTINKPNTISYRENGKEWKPIYTHEKGGIFAKFVTQNLEGGLDSCETILLKGDEIQIKHRYQNTRDETNIFIHETGLFHSDFKLKIPAENFVMDTKMILNIHRIRRINKGDCSDDTIYDFNINNNIKKGMVENYGCVLNRMK